MEFTAGYRSLSDSDAEWTHTAELALSGNLVFWGLAPKQNFQVSVHLISLAWGLYQGYREVGSISCFS